MNHKYDLFEGQITDQYEFLIFVAFPIGGKNIEGEHGKIKFEWAITPALIVGSRSNLYQKNAFFKSFWYDVLYHKYGVLIQQFQV